MKNYFFGKDLNKIHSKYIILLFLAHVHRDSLFEKKNHLSYLTLCLTKDLQQRSLTDENVKASNTCFGAKGFLTGLKHCCYFFVDYLLFKKCKQWAEVTAFCVISDYSAATNVEHASNVFTG